MLNKSTFQYSADLFLRLIGVVYFLAIYSLWSQIHGLIGENGILPLRNFFNSAAEQLGSGACFSYPSILWWFQDNTSISVLCIVGMAFSVLLFFGFIPLISTIILWGIYLSLTTAGQVFLAFQWDNLLLEAGFLAILLSPPVWRSRPSSNPAVPKVIIFLLYWLLFRLMFASGFVKLASHDESWWNLTALTYHFWSQPLPVWISWYVHQSPLWLLKSAVAVMFFIELVVPFFIFAPRKFRYAVFVVFVLFQTTILMTGNYGFFNILTIVLCFLLLDDQVFIRGNREVVVRPVPLWTRSVFNTVRISATVIIMFVSILLFVSMFKVAVPLPGPILATVRAIMPYRSINHYGLFAAMTKSRPEIIIEGSMDGQNWLAYEFPYKPGDVYRTPLFTAPHMPRLDWQMWFAALGNYQGNPWLINMMYRLLEGEPAVLSLFEYNPFPSSPPKMIRAVLYEYTFAGPEQNKKQFLWWNRELKGLYCPVLTKSP